MGFGSPTCLLLTFLRSSAKRLYSGTLCRRYCTMRAVSRGLRLTGPPGLLLFEPPPSMRASEWSWVSSIIRRGTERVGGRKF